MATGSITKITLPDGGTRWRARADAGTDPGTGKRRQQMKTFATKKEGEGWLREQQRRADRGEWGSAGKQTLGEWIAEWLEGPGSRGKRDSTVRSYESLLRTHITPAIGGTPMAKLTPTALERTLAALEQHLKPSSVQTLFAVLRKLLADAERLGVIQDNPLRRVQRPTARRHERPAWTGEQAHAFLGATQGDPDYVLWLALLTTGTRIGEVLALAWSDVAWEAGALTVRRTLTQNRKGTEVMGDTTKGGRTRTIPAPPVLVAALGPARVRYHGRWGTRREKYDFLDGHALEDTPWEDVVPSSPLYLFVPTDAAARQDYERGAALDEAMPVHVLGFQSHRDHLAVAFDEATLRGRIEDLRDARATDEQLRERYDLKDNRDWSLASARARLRADSAWGRHLRRVSYRPFDLRWCYYDEAAMDYPRAELRQHMLRENLSLCTVRQTGAEAWRHVLVADGPTPAVLLEIKDGAYAFPLYRYPQPDESDVPRLRMLDWEVERLVADVKTGRVPAAEMQARKAAIQTRFAHLYPEERYPRCPNFDSAFLAGVEERTGLAFSARDGGDLVATFDARQLFSAIYATLHATAYRVRFNDALKRGFPRVFLPADRTIFAQLAGLGDEMIAVHLPAAGLAMATRFPIPGSGVVGAGFPRYQPPTEDGASGRVLINGPEAGSGGAGQYFDGVDEATWAFELGGYRPSERWLKDRRGRTPESAQASAAAINDRKKP